MNRRIDTNNNLNKVILVKIAAFPVGVVTAPGCVVVVVTAPGCIVVVVVTAPGCVVVVVTAPGCVVVVVTTPGCVVVDDDCSNGLRSPTCVVN